MNAITKEFTDAVETRLQGFDGELKTFQAILNELEQKAARPGGGYASRLASVGSQFIEDENVKSFLSDVQGGRRIGMEAKAVITSATTDANGSAGDLATAYRDSAFLLPRRRLTMRSLIPVVNVTSGSVEVPKQTGYTNSAATVAEGAEKPQSELKYDLANVPIRTIAHWVLASRQILDDAPQLQGLIDNDLLYGLDYVEDLQILSGGGSGTDLNGLYTQATALASNPMVVASPNKMDVIGAAILQQNNTDFPATGIVINPADWTSMQLTKDSAGNYIIGGPQTVASPQLFGLPVIATPAMTVDKFMVGHFPAATLYERWGKRVEVSTEDSDNFRKNLVTVLAECRIGLALKNTLAMTKGDFSDAITDLTS